MTLSLVNIRSSFENFCLESSSVASLASIKEQVFDRICNAAAGTRAGVAKKVIFNSFDFDFTLYLLEMGHARNSNAVCVESRRQICRQIRRTFRLDPMLQRVYKVLINSLLNLLNMNF